jgi:hypothetical protein
MTGILCGVVAGIVASLVCFTVNSYIMKAVGDKAVVIYIPAIEEIAKTSAAMALNGNLMLSHMVFGAIEALYDLYNSPKEYSLTASLLSLVSHSVLGIITISAVSFFEYPVLAVGISATIHSLWNRFITGYTG